MVHFALQEATAAFVIMLILSRLIISYSLPSSRFAEKTACRTRLSTNVAPAVTHPRSCCTITSTKLCARHFTQSTTSSSTEDVVSLAQRQKDKLVMDMLYRVRQCNIVPKEKKDKLVNFVINGKLLGKPSLELAERLDQTPIFSLDSGTLVLTAEAGTSRNERTQNIHKIMLQLKEEGIITGWRDEFLSVSSGFYDEPVFLIERAAAPVFGTQAYGVHINGYVRDETGEIRLWVARRSHTKSKYPGMLDHIVAGGQPYGISPMENVIKECGEEAGIPRDLAQAARPAGAISYEYSGKTGMERACLFCYDLELPKDFTPQVVDGEVDEFFLWTLDEVAATMDPNCQDPYKPNCYLVIIDFMLRNGFISPESPGYLNILRELRSGLCA